MNISDNYFPGSQLSIDGGVDFRIWAPKKNKAEVVILNQNKVKEENVYPMNKDNSGYFSTYVKRAQAGTRYKYRFDDNDFLVPDPFSFYQPEGPHGASEIIDLNFKWTDSDWAGLNPHGNIVYELHTGTFTKEGTWNAASKELKELSLLGITVIELMPIAEFPGKFGWGYDGVNFFAPYHIYGRPEDLMSFINEAHKVNIGVILDVVYNHFGPDGNFLIEFSDSYFSKKNKTDWGEALNYDEADSRYVRNFIKHNALYWIKRFHFDGLRLDATQDIYDNSDIHILSELQSFLRKEITNKKLYFVAENEPQHINLVEPVDKGGYGLDALWNDDYHHTAMVALTGKSEAYYTDYKGTAQEFVSAAKYGFLYQGQWYKWQKKRRGVPSFGKDKSHFVMYIQNHDQIANSGRGLRIHLLSDPGRYKAVTAFTVLVPGTPMIFMGQEFNASSPFYFFADHNKELADKVYNGRNEFLKQFRSLAVPEMIKCLPDPSRESSFNNSKLDFNERKKNAHIYKMYKDLFKLKKTDSVLNDPNVIIDGAVLSNNCFVIRYFGSEEDMLLVVNLGIDFNYSPAPEPLLAPLLNKVWQVLFSTEDPEYNGCGTPPLETEENWIIPGHSAVLLKTSDNPEFI